MSKTISTPKASNSFVHQFKNEQIISEIWRLYFGCNSSSDVITTPPKLTLHSIANRLQVEISDVSTKATVLIIGNISSGKSTFINWYCNSFVQKTGMAIETNGFTIVTAGKIKNELGGESTIMLYPYLQPIVHENPGLLQNLSTKTCPSLAGRLSLLSFIDTPGIMDGTIPHSFDVENVLISLAPRVDLILAFFEPVGQALGSRMLSLLNRMFKEHPEKIRLCLSKIDEVQSEQERLKIIIQATQSITSKVPTRHGFDLIPIFIPGAKSGSYLSDASILHCSDSPQNISSTRSSGIANRIGDIVLEIEQSTERKVQSTINNLKTDCDKLLEVANSVFEEDCERRYSINASIQKQKRCYRLFQISVFTFLFALLFIHIIHSTQSFTSWWFDQRYSTDIFRIEQWLLTVLITTVAVSNYILNIPYLMSFLYSTLIGLLTLTAYKRINAKMVDVLSNEDVAALRDDIQFIESTIHRWKILNNSYLQDEELDGE